MRVKSDHCGARTDVCSQRQVIEKHWDRLYNLLYLDYSTREDNNTFSDFGDLGRAGRTRSHTHTDSEMHIPNSALQPTHIHNYIPDL